MNIEVFAEWLHRQGHSIIKTLSSYWTEVGPRILQSFPYHRVISPTEEELKYLLLRHSFIGLRYSTPMSASAGRASYHVVFQGHEYSLESLPKKARYDVRKGMENACIQQISFSRLAKEGWQLRSDTLARQGRIGAESQKWWEKLCYSAEGLPGFETWAAIIDGKLAASLIAFSDESCCSILYQQSLSEHLSKGINNALTFVFTNAMLRRSQQSSIFYGLQSLDAPVSVDEYKFRMRFTAKPVKQRVVFHPLFAPFANRLSSAVLHGIHCRCPSISSIAKAEGFIRFNLEGGKPLEKQDLPKPLIEQKKITLKV